MSSSFRFIPALHGFRAVAAMEVLMFHWTQLFPGFNTWLAAYHVPGHPWLNPSWLYAMGWEGVVLFFVLSGYLLTSQWQGRPLTPQTVGHFYLRRAMRIYPAVWLQLVVLLVLAWVLPQVFVALSWPDALLNAVLWVNLPPIFAPLLNDVWWTLPVELLFYLFLPVLLGLKRRMGLGFVAVLVLAITFGWRWAIMARYAGQDLSSSLTVLDALPGVLAVFGAGCAAAMLQHRVLPQYSKPLLVLSMLALVALQALLVSQIETYWQGGWLLGIWNSLLALSLAGIVVAVCRDTQGILQRALSARPMVWLGNLSFGIYLWHFPVMKGLQKLWPQTTISVTASWACCW